MNELMYSFRDNDVRVVMKDNEPWFLAKDVCEILEVSNTSQALQRLDLDERYMFNIGRQGETNFVNESGLYSLVLGSRKPEAKQFKKWITSEVLPSIRKHGAYATDVTLEKMISEPDFAIKLLTKLKEEKELKDALNSELEEQKPKVLLAESIINSQDLIGIGELAKIIKQNGYDIGEKRLFKWLRDNKYLMYRNNQNIPTQYAIERGWFKIIERTITNGDSIKISITPKVTGKGQEYFVNKFLGY